MSEPELLQEFEDVIGEIRKSGFPPMYKKLLTGMLHGAKMLQNGKSDDVALNGKITGQNALATSYHALYHVDMEQRVTREVLDGMVKTLGNMRTGGNGEIIVKQDRAWLVEALKFVVPAIGKYLCVCATLIILGWLAIDALLVFYGHGEKVSEARGSVVEQVTGGK